MSGLKLVRYLLWNTVGHFAEKLPYDVARFFAIARFDDQLIVFDTKSRLARCSTVSNVLANAF